MQGLSQKMPKKINCWIVTEGIAGTENQCIGVAEALGVAPEIKRINLRMPWKTLSPYLRVESAATFTPALCPDPEYGWPDLLIASGRKSIAASRYIKKQSGGKTFTVQIQDPRISPKHFDLVAVPKHDPTRGENVIVTTAAPNKITPEKLKDARKEFATFESIKSPRVAVLIGGESKTYSFDKERMYEISQQLGTLDVGLMITTSRRTPDECKYLLQNMLEASDIDTEHFIWDGHGQNPYMGILAWADTILVTEDSTSMLSEAGTTGKPVYMIEMDRKANKRQSRIDKMHENLRQSGCLRDFTGNLETWPYEPLNDATLVANEIRKRMNL